MRFETFISKKYLLSKDHKALVSLITAISIIGVALGVTSLIVVIAVMDGFDKDLIDRMIGVFSHIEVRMADGSPLRDYDSFAKSFENEKDVVAVSPLITRPAMMQKAKEIDAPKEGAMIRGIDLKKEGKVTKLNHNIIKGTGTPGAKEIVLGAQLADKLYVDVGDKIYVVSKIAMTANGPHVAIRELKVVGLFKSGLYEIDASLAYTDIPTAQNIFIMGNEVDSVHLKLTEPFIAHKVKDRISQRLGDIYDIRTWDELNQSFFLALRLEKFAMFIILLMIVIVAAFNIIGTLTMVVTEKTREIGILKSMGASNTSIMKIFLYEGLIIGILGTALGVIAGFIICYLIANYVPIPLPEAVYGIEKLPATINYTSVLIIVVSALSICLGAAVYPARKAAQLNPVEALRYE